MKKIIAVLSIITLLVNCSNKNNEKTFVDIGISIKYLNKEGENLLEISNGYKIADIKVYHKIKGEWNEYNKSNLDAPKGIKIVDREDGKYLLVFPSITFSEDNKSETKIKFSDADADIIKAEINKKSNSMYVTKVWYNNVLKNGGTKSGRTFEIIK